MYFTPRILALFILILLPSFSGILLAQESDQRILRGTVKDERNEPISFVYVVFAKAQNRGVLTNEEGEFELPFRAEDLTDTILVSRIGYSVYRFPLASLPQGATKLDIQLKIEMVDIPVIIVSASKTPDAIIRKAIDRIPQNYGTPRFQMTAYYRQFGLRNGAYTDISEAFLTVEDRSYNSPNAKSLIFLDHLERNVFDKNQTSDFLYTDENPIYSLYENQNNSARFHHVHWMSFGKKDFFEVFDFEMLTVKTNERDTLVEIGYEINLERANISETALQTLAGWTRGKVVISLKDYGIIRNTRGDKNGNVFSEVYYTRLSPVEKYFPVRITSVYAIDYGKDDYYVCNRMICFTQITNNEKLMSAYKPIQRVARKKSISEIKYKASDEVDADRMMLRIPAPKAEAVEAARREYQRQQLGLQAEEGEK